MKDNLYPLGRDNPEFFNEHLVDALTSPLPIQSLEPPRKSWIVTLLTEIFAGDGRADDDPFHPDNRPKETVIKRNDSGDYPKVEYSAKGPEPVPWFIPVAFVFFVAIFLFAAGAGVFECARSYGDSVGEKALGATR